MPKLAPNNTCTGCLSCIDACNHNAIKIKNRYGLLYPVIEFDLCVDCRLCEKSCPIVSPLENDFDIHNSVAFATWSTDNSIRINAASGGFCTCFAINIIKKGGKVATCSWVNGLPKFILTNNLQDLRTTANCKYVQSNPSGIYKVVRQELKKGTNILFIGLPCQVAGIKTFLRGKFDDLLITIELICSPPASMLAVDFQNKLSKSQLLRFRTKDDAHNWGHDKNLLIRKDGKEIFVENGSVNDFFYKIFSSDLTARKSCMNCQFASFKRQADYIVGDYHGYEGNGENGVSLVISKNDKTYQYLQDIQGLHIEQTDIKQALSGNPRFYVGKNMMQYHPAFYFRKKFHKLPESMRMGFLLLKMPYKLLWGFYRVLDKVNIWINYRKLKKIFNEENRYNYNTKSR